uniref:Putative gtp-binding adp-ribosylation factor arf1 n=1 Tax=Lutzomyia longipalpis TaxID=7200 RepID=A0A1B0CR86_LUTLO
MGNTCWKRRVAPAKDDPLNILLLGLDGAGKTTLGQSLLKPRPTAPPKPTTGCQVFPLRVHGHRVELTEVGGREDVRPLWRHYFLDALGLIFIVDGSKWQRLAEARDILQQLMQNELLQTKPLLVLVNKQDHPNAVDHLDVIDFFNLSDYANAFKTPTHVLGVCALEEASKNRTAEGINWLVSNIKTNHDALRRRNHILREIVNHKSKKGRTSIIRTLSARVRRKKTANNLAID